MGHHTYIESVQQKWRRPREGDENKGQYRQTSCKEAHKIKKKKQIKFIYLFICKYKTFEWIKK